MTKEEALVRVRGYLTDYLPSDNADEIDEIMKALESTSYKLKKAKEIIKENFGYGNCGLFNSQHFFGDPMDTIYDEDGLRIDICYYYEYFNVFGLNDEEFNELEDYYDKLGE